jgi:hypothetical protein
MTAVVPPEDLRIDVGSIERSLSELWRVQTKEGDEAITRAALWNVVAHTASSADQAHATEILCQTAESVPQRTIVIHANPGAAPELASWIGANCHLGITQGSYNPGGVGQSAGTHDGGGAADLDMGKLCGKRTRRVVRALRIVGFAAWHRPAIPGVWGEHIHAIAISDPDLAPAAADQVWDYYTHHDGLADNAADAGPRVGFHTWEAYLRRS